MALSVLNQIHVVDTYLNEIEIYSKMFKNNMNVAQKKYKETYFKLHVSEIFTTH